MLYKNLEKFLKIKGNEVTLDINLFREILSAAILSSKHFNSDFYIKNNPDLEKSKFANSAITHYARSGYFMNKLPSSIKIDEEFYLKENIDIKDGVLKNTIRDLQEHFDANGFYEGRLPFKGFSIWAKL
jgi:hypothetical protein